MTMWGSCGLLPVILLMNEELKKGEHTVRWNGLNDSGGQLNNGIYIVKLLINNVSQSNVKLVLNK